MFWRCLLERQTAWAAEPKTVALAAEPVGRAAVKARGAGGARARGGEGEAAGACTCRRDELCILVRPRGGPGGASGGPFMCVGRSSPVVCAWIYHVRVGAGRGISK